MTQPDYLHFQGKHMCQFIPEMAIRSRREMSTRDMINEFTVKNDQQSYLKYYSPGTIPSDHLNQFTQQSGRLDDRDYTRHVEFGATKSPLESNKYLSRMGIVDQEQNIIREFNSAVHDSKNKEGSDMVGKLIRRNFNNEWFYDKAQDTVDSIVKTKDNYMKSYR